MRSTDEGKTILEKVKMIELCELDREQAVLVNFHKKNCFLQYMTVFL